MTQFFQPSLEITTEKLNIKKEKQRILVFLIRESKFILLLSLGIISVSMCHVLSEHFCRSSTYSHSVSQSTDPSPPSKPQPSNFFVIPGTGKLSKSPQALENLSSSSMQTKSLDNSNILIVFNSKTYTHFRTACKHI